MSNNGENPENDKLPSIQTFPPKLSTPHTHTASFPFFSPPFRLLHFDSVLVLWNLTVESILSETKWYFTPAAVSCCNFLFKHLYTPPMPFKTSEPSYCVMTEWSAGRGDATVGRGYEMRAIVLNCILLYYFTTPFDIHGFIFDLLAASAFGSNSCPQCHVHEVRNYVQCPLNAKELYTGIIV